MSFHRWIGASRLRRLVRPGLLGIGVAIGVTGCGAIIRGGIDTQPRVALGEGAFDTPGEIVHGEAVAYMPATAWEGCDPDLAAYAPALVQGFQPDREGAAYDYFADAIGAPVCTSDGGHVRIDTERPTMYARVERANVHGRSLKQLTYVFWYPERPLGVVETGSVDGGILRVTLGADGSPAVFEYSQPCGCFHGVFASQHAEALARQEFGAPVGNREFSIEAPPQAGDWIVRAVVTARTGERPVLYVTAGKHFCEAIRFVPRDADLRTGGSVPYALLPYESLRSIESDDGERRSMFNERDLVRGARRWKEEVVFSDLDNPGWPRHLDAMRIHWDHDSWSDPDLLAHNLRMPRGVAGLAWAPHAGWAGGEGAVAGAEPPGRPAAVLFVNRYCVGCQRVKKEVMQSERVRAALEGLAFTVVETSTSEGAAIAADRRVDEVPVLICTDAMGHEIVRSADLDTDSKVVALLERLRSAAADAGGD